MNHMFFFGYGYSASYLAKILRKEGWKLSGTTRSNSKVNKMWEHGVEPHIWTGETPMEAPLRVTKGVTHILHSIPPTQGFDPVMKHHHRLLSRLSPDLSWYGYISTTSVYGDTQGQWAEEDFEPNPGLARGKARLRVENTHQALCKQTGLPLHIFRAGAIYGPIRNAIRRALSGNAQLIHKAGHQTSRIHVEDLAQVLRASMDKPNPGAVYNAVDDMPTGFELPTALAYELIGKPIPPTLEYEEVKDELAPSVNLFFAESRLVSNGKIKSELGIELIYPTYKEGLEAIAAARRSDMANEAS